MGLALTVTGHFNLFPHVKHQIAQLLILHHIVIPIVKELQILAYVEGNVKGMWYRV